MHTSHQSGKETEQQKAERLTGCKLGKPFFVYKGFSLSAQGGEAPDVFLDFGGERLVLGETEATVFIQAFHQALKWCKDGYTEGMPI